MFEFLLWRIYVLQSFNLHSLNLHFQDILAYSNLILSHSLFKWDNSSNFFANNEMYNAISNKFNILSCHDQHGTTIIYDDMVSLSNINLITNLGVKLILATFNKDKWEALHVIVVSKLPKMQANYLISILNNILQKNAYKLSNSNNWWFQYRYVNKHIIINKHYKTFMNNIQYQNCIAQKYHNL
jgi:hypothetical protein